MKKIFDIVEAHLPDEQKDDIKSKVDGAISSLIEKNEITLKKDLSSRYGVDFFEEDVSKSFNNKNFVRKELLEELEANNLKLSEEYENLKKNVVELEQAGTYSEASIKLLTRGFNAERLESIKPLLTGQGSIDEKVDRIQEQLPELFLKKTEFRRTGPDTDNRQVLSGAEKYFQKKKK